MIDSSPGSGVPDRLAAALSDRYRIERELGEGGMATVFLAQDLKHNRQVALKVLKPELAAVVGAERFLAEIETTAQLQHPHILPLFDSGEADTFLYYVMPFVEGETLRDRLDRERQLPVEEAVGLAGKVAAALAYAHDNGVLHRDIKPANILLSRGEPLVADFGIALALGAAGGGRLTETGLSVGTPYYMSPEQATGDQYVGPPSDIYALGCVLYEMLVGDPPHSGSTAQAVLGKIITGAPVDPRGERPSIPAHVDAALRKALERLPADRFGTADAFAQALRDPSFRHGVGAGATPGRAGVWKPVALVASAVAVAALAAAAVLARGEPPAPRDVGLPYDAPMRVGFSQRAMAVSRDGNFMVYEARVPGGRELWYRSLTDMEARPLRGTEGATGQPILSPDGSRVAFMADEELKVLDMASGGVTLVGQASMITGGQWRDDGLIVYADDDGRFLRWVDPETGPVRVDTVSYCLYPQLLDGDARMMCSGGSWKFAFSRDAADPEDYRFWTRAAGTGADGATIRGAQFRVVDDDYLVYVSIDGSLMAAPIEDRGAQIVGRSVTMVPGLRRETYTGAGQWDLTADGTLVHAFGPNAEAGRMVRLTRNGDLEPLRVDEAVHLRYRESPDGRRLATVVELVQGQELRVYDLRTGNYEVLERDFFIGAPMWSPDGTSLAYAMNSQDDFRDDLLYLKDVDQPGDARVLLDMKNGRAGFQASTFLSPDSLLVGVGTAGRSAMLVNPTSDPVQVDSLPLDPIFLSISPNRRWLAFQEQGVLGIQLRPWPAMNRRYTVSQTGAEPQWLADGSLVFYTPVTDESSQAGFVFYRVPMTPDREPPFGPPELIVADPRYADTPGWSYAPDRDGGVIYLQGPEEDLVRYVRVIPGWVEQMKAAVREANR